MELLYGSYLLATLGCTYYVLYNHFSQKWKPKEDETSFKKTILANRKAKIAALAIVLVAWYLQDAYRHRYSPEAVAMKKIDTLLDQWQAEGKGEVIEELDALSTSGRPWEYQDDPYEDQP